MLSNKKPLGDGNVKLPSHIKPKKVVGRKFVMEKGPEEYIPNVYKGHVDDEVVESLIDNDN
jgi:hypothetical protein